MLNGAAMTVDLSGRVAVVTGAASGIGLGCARLLAQSGAAVVVADKNGPGADAARDEIVAKGGKAVAVEVDVASSAQVHAMVDRTLAAYPQIDILVHCAGGGIKRNDIVDLTDEEWHAGIGSNLDGTMFVMRAVARHMIPRRAGTMVVIASDRGLLGDKSRAAYAAAKGGVIALVKTLALELGTYEITVNALNPGTTNTPAVQRGMTPELKAERLKTDPLGKMSEPEDVAEIVLFLAGPAARFMTGQLITTRMRAG